ncbi:hypothetical protein BKA93DRAFT_833949 [Sparassis latifolia]
MLTTRQSDPCAGLGIASFPTEYNFTLAAWNWTLPNANDTGAPLVIGQAGAVDGESFGVLSTWATYSYAEWTTFSLIDGALIPYSADGAASNGVDANIFSGEELLWVFTVNPPPPAEIYCGVADPDPAGGYEYAALAVNGSTDGFSLCLLGEPPYVQNNIVYRASPNNTDGYNYESCYGVRVQILPLS